MLSPWSTSPLCDRSQRPNISDAERESLLQACDANEETFEQLLDADKYDKLRQQGVRTLSHRAMQGALMIHLYR